MGTHIRLTASDGHAFDAYRADPETPPKAGLIVVQEIFGVTAHLRAITDEDGRILVLMSHNTDVADAWEREGEDPRFFERFSPDGYGLGINVLLYAMSH